VTDVRAALLLTNRLVALDVRPFAAREFWALAERVDLGTLLDQPASAVAELAGVDAGEADRICALLDAATAFAFEQERMADGGVVLVSALDPAFPASLCERLGAACPPFLLVAGSAEWLSRPMLGVVGSRDASPDALAVAAQAAGVATDAGWPVVSGSARGVDQAAMDAAAEAVGIPAEGILRAARNADVRRRVHAGELCLASPYAPNAPFTATHATGRNKLIYALAQVTLVVAAEHGKGGTWSGATEALDHRYGTVAVWTGGGSGPGNAALARHGATPVADLTALLTTEPSPPPPTQAPLF
jgi:predicted Rossmann fold nucleotide-binding protein DprA/Smf involved in DNA uptake